MQLRYEKTATNDSPFIVQQLEHLDYATAQRLHNLGLHVGSQLTVLYRYPFHGPVIVAFDQQRIGIRYAIFHSLVEEH